LNKAGLLQVYVQTAKGVLIEINPSVRIPRTFKRFSGLMGEYSVGAWFGRSVVLCLPAVGLDGLLVVRSVWGEDERRFRADSSTGRSSLGV
jgi:hypothetical protein